MTAPVMAAVVAVALTTAVAVSGSAAEATAAMSSSAAATAAVAAVLPRGLAGGGRWPREPRWRQLSWLRMSRRWLSLRRLLRQRFSGGD